MTYEITITADGASIPELAEAQDQFRRVLEAGLGGLDRFKPAFAAYTKGFDHGVGALTPEELELHEVWATAYADADAAAKAALGRAEGVDVLVRLTA